MNSVVVTAPPRRPVPAAPRPALPVVPAARPAAPAAPRAVAPKVAAPTAPVAPAAPRPVAVPVKQVRQPVAAQPAPQAFSAVAGHTLAEVWRPTWITDMVGNRKVMSDLAQRFRDGTLRRSIGVFGPSGVGKTTLNMIFAKSMTCQHPQDDGQPCGTCDSCAVFDALDYRNNHPDILVMNCAAKTGIDDIRGMLVTARAYPLLGRHRVIFLDEIQGLSNAAEQALLTDLEHPPANTMFLIGSMSPEQVSRAILDRCFQVNLGAADKTSLTTRLCFIANAERVKLDRAIAEAIADVSDGYPRAAVQMLDNVLTRIRSGQSVDVERAHEFVSTVAHQSPFNLAKAALIAIYSGSPKDFVAAVSASDNPAYMLRTMIAQNGESIRYSIDNTAIANKFAAFTARDLAAASVKHKVTMMRRAEIGRALEETLKLVASYQVDALSALTHTVVLLSAKASA